MKLLLIFLRSLFLVIPISLEAPSASFANGLVEQLPQQHHHQQRKQDPARNLQQACACQPATIAFQLALEQPCETQIVMQAPGIESFECTIENLSTGVDDVTPPAVVTSVQILELDMNNQIIGQSETSGSYSNGDALQFESEVSDSSATLPKSLQVLIRGRQLLDDQSSDVILNSFIIDYSGVCLSSADAPLLSLGQRLGWFIVVDIGGPSTTFCPSFYESETTAPTISPATFVDRCRRRRAKRQ